MEHLLFGKFIGEPFALTPLIADDVALVRQAGAIERLKQEAHAVAFQPQPESELIAGQGFEIVRPIEIGSAINIRRADRFEVPEMRFFAHVFRAFEHHVFK